MVKFNLELSSNNIFGSLSFSIVHVELKKQICLHVLLGLENHPCFKAIVLKMYSCV